MKELLLDACVVINLTASGVPFQDLARRNGVRFVMASPAAGEVLYLRERIDMMGYARRGDLRIVDLEPDELASFVELAQRVDDGEAATLAVSVHRGWPVATDDRKAQQLARDLEPPIEPITTSALLHGWASKQDEPAERVAEVLRRIETRARFVPPRSDPHRRWWSETGR